MVAEYVGWEMLRTAEAATSSTQLPFPSSPLRVKKKIGGSSSTGESTAEYGGL